jgi:hypothetical protein
MNKNFVKLLRAIVNLSQFREILILYLLERKKNIPVPGPDQGVGHHQGDVVRVGPTTALDGYSDVGQRHAIIAGADIGT